MPKFLNLLVFTLTFVAPATQAWMQPPSGWPSIKLPVDGVEQRTGPNGRRGVLPYSSQPEQAAVAKLHQVQKQHIKVATTVALVGLLWFGPLTTQPASAAISSEEFQVLVEKIDALAAKIDALAAKSDALAVMFKERFEALAKKIDSKAIEYTYVPAIAASFSAATILLAGYNTDGKLESGLDEIRKSVKEDSKNSLAKDKADFLGLVVLLLFLGNILLRLQH